MQTKPKVKAPNSKEYYYTQNIVQSLNLKTVCQEAACPNIGECWEKKHITVMILGSICTRACAFCNVKTGVPNQVDPQEPQRLALSIGLLNLSHVVITSVDRDDLKDGGAEQFAKCITAIRATAPNTTIEILTPDFLRKEGAIEIIAQSKPDVFNHNLETVPSLYRRIRPGARYYNSLHLLHQIKKLDHNIFTKSGLMVGLGENSEEVLQVMDDLRAASVDFLTIGQYLQPTPKHAKVIKYVEESEFKYYEKAAKAKGFHMVSASALTRSSYHAEEDFNKLKINKQNSINNYAL